MWTFHKIYKNPNKSEPIDEINHVIQNRKGVFISQRNVKSLTFTIKYIMKNYFEIQKSMMKNNLPTRKKFISDLLILFFLLQVDLF